MGGRNGGEGGGGEVSVPDRVDALFEVVICLATYIVDGSTRIDRQKGTVRKTGALSTDDGKGGC